MTNKIKNIVKEIPPYICILILAIAVGVLLRTYNFHDWLRFNADQGRDSELVSKVIEGKEPIPLLGPKAGGTEFKLGPAFYYFQIASAKIFGNYPDKMTYPDLITGILCIPLLFLFLRKYFDKNIALVLSAIFSVSSYAIRYSRFAWNPNSTPFWTLLTLYAISEATNDKQKNRIFWSIIAGVAIGIGVQLHTTLLLFLPITTIIVFGYLSLKKNWRILKYFLIIFLISLFINAPQFIHEYQYKGENVKAFFAGMGKKQNSASFLEKVGRSSSCWVQGNVDIISGWEISDTCTLKAEKKNDLTVFIIGSLFVLGGTILGFRYLFKEKDIEKKSFLSVIFSYVIVSYVIFIPLAFELSVRFYLVLIFLPFVLLGFWFKFILENTKKCKLCLLILICALLMTSNLFFVLKYFKSLASYANKGGSVNVVILGQVEAFSNFIIENSSDHSKIIVTGNAKFLFKAFKPIKYLVERSDKKVFELDKKETVPNRYFYIARSNKRESLLNDQSVLVIAHKTYGRFTILLVERK